MSVTSEQLKGFDQVDPVIQQAASKIIHRNPNLHLWLRTIVTTQHLDEVQIVTEYRGRLTWEGYYYHFKIIHQAESEKSLVYGNGWLTLELNEHKAYYRQHLTIMSELLEHLNQKRTKTTWVANDEPSLTVTSRLLSFSPEAISNSFLSLLKEAVFVGRIIANFDRDHKHSLENYGEQLNQLLKG